MMYTTIFHVLFRSPFGPHYYLYILIRAWVCPPRPYIEIIPHSLLRPCIFNFCSLYGAVVPVSNQSLLSSTPQEKDKEIMMSIGHMMSSCPHTSGSNLLTPKKCSLAHLPSYMTHLSIFPTVLASKTSKNLQMVTKKAKINLFLLKIIEFPQKYQKPSKRAQNSPKIK